ncbi:hypothetical protein H096_24716, partial [Pseudomonas sp. FH1]
RVIEYQTGGALSWD